MIKNILNEYDEEWAKSAALELENIRYANKLTMTKFVDRIGIPYDRYYKYEKGNHMVPISVLKKVSLEFNEDYYEMLKRIDSRVTVDIDPANYLGEEK